MLLHQFLIIFLTAMTPVGELRAALPLAVLFYKWAWLPAYLVSVAGNILAALIWWYFLEYSYEFLIRKSGWARRFFNWWLPRTRTKFVKHYERWGEVALVLFVAIPLPVTGAWTGVTAAWLFGFKFRTAITGMALGVVLAGLAVSFLLWGGLNLL